jgi:DNA polymerase III gamma/tau subunit
MLSTLFVGLNQDQLLDQAVKNLFGEKTGWINNPDVLLLTEDQGAPSIGVESVRNWMRKLQLKPIKFKSRLAVIRNAERLTVEAQNSLLKVLEEPPESVQVVLLSSQAEVLLPTVLSRVVVESKNQKSSIENQILNNEAEEKFRKILTTEPMARLVKTAELANTREAAEKLVIDWLHMSHEWLTSPPLRGRAGGRQLSRTELLRVAKLLTRALKYLKANTHSQLTMDWLLLRLPSVKGV